VENQDELLENPSAEETPVESETTEDS